MDLDGKTAFITGGASGIGYGMAEAFAARGMKIVLTDARADALAEAAQHLQAAGATVLPVTLDVMDRDAMAAAAQAAEAAFGGVDVVCNNAGVTVRAPLDEVTYQDWDWVLGVNLGGVVNGIVTFLPLLKARGGGHIVNTASVAGLHGMQGLGPYVTSKFAVVGLSETLRLDVARYDIGVSVLCPGVVRTAFRNSELYRPAAFSVGARPEPEAPPLDPGLANAMEPREVGERVADAVVANRLYILTHPEFRARSRPGASAWSKPSATAVCSGWPPATPWAGTDRARACRRLR